MSDIKAAYLPLVSLSPGDIPTDREERGSAGKSAGQPFPASPSAFVTSGDKSGGDIYMATISATDCDPKETA